MSGDVKLLAKEISQGANIDDATVDGWTALMMAAESNHLGAVVGLLGHGARTDLQDERGWTALMKACKLGHGGVVTELVRAGADLSLQSHDGRTAAEWAEVYEHKVVQELLKPGATLPPAPVPESDPPQVESEEPANPAVDGYLSSLSAMVEGSHPEAQPPAEPSRGSQPATTTVWAETPAGSGALDGPQSERRHPAPDGNSQVATAMVALTPGRSDHLPAQATRDSDSPSGMGGVDGGESQLMGELKLLRRRIGLLETQGAAQVSSSTALSTSEQQVSTASLCSLDPCPRRQAPRARLTTCDDARGRSSRREPCGMSAT